MAEITTINQNPIDDNRQVHEALLANQTGTTPGALMELTATGTLQRHSTEGGKNERLFLLENQALGNNIDTQPAASVTVRYLRAWPGDVIYAWRNSAGACTANTTYMVSSGSGALIEGDDAETDNELVGLALETQTAGSGSRLLIRVV